MIGLMSLLDEALGMHANPKKKNCIREGFLQEGSGKKAKRHVADADCIAVSPVCRR